MPKDVFLDTCPSCWSAAKVEDYEEDTSRLWRVRCKYCSFKCDGFQVRSNAIKRWNTRVKEPKS